MNVLCVEDYLRLGAADYVDKSAGYPQRLPFALERAHLKAASTREQAAVTRFADGTPRVMVAHENVTDRKLAELRLTQYQAELEALVAARTAELARTNLELVRADRHGHFEQHLATAFVERNFVTGRCGRLRS